MNIIFNKYILIIYVFFIVQQSIFMNFKVFLLIFALLIFLSKYSSIFFNIFDISVKSKYRYIRNYRYFIPWIRLHTCQNKFNFEVKLLQQIMCLNFSLCYRIGEIVEANWQSHQAKFTHVIKPSSLMLAS